MTYFPRDLALASKYGMQWAARGGLIDHSDQWSSGLFKEMSISFYPLKST